METTVVSSVATGAELHCSVLEEDWQRGQRYSAQWHSLSMPPQQHRSPVAESEKYQEALRCLQHFLSGAISQRPSAPKVLTRRKPQQQVFEPSATTPVTQQSPLHSPKAWPRFRGASG